MEANANWNKRYQENLMRLKSGDLYQVARVIKSLMQEGFPAWTFHRRAEDAS
ncbi:MAG: hypothetical protein V8R75_14410 [Oscillospiraceae bacterium]